MCVCLCTAPYSGTHVVAEQVEKEKMKCKKQLDEMTSQVGAAKYELAQAKKLETSLVEQQNHMSVEMAAEKRQRDISAAELQRCDYQSYY